MAKRKHTKAKSDKIYFTEDTQAAIILYNKSTNMDERELLFKNHISKPLDKLAENVINRFKFPYVNQSFDDTKRQVISHLVINLQKYTEHKGKAFSYFSVVAKNYLIHHNNKGYEQEKRDVSLSDESTQYVQIEEIHGMAAPNAQEHDDIREFVKLLVEYWDSNMHLHFKKKRDIDIASAVIELFRRVEYIENFKKKALYLMIREMTDCKTTYITKIVNRMRDYIIIQFRQYNSTGKIENPNQVQYLN